MTHPAPPLPPSPEGPDTMGMPLAHRRFTVDEYHRMAEVGILGEDDRVELLDGDSEPEPDVAVVEPRDDFYAGAHPTPAEILLIVEVADTSLRYDRLRKVPDYARAGIPEV